MKQRQFAMNLLVRAANFSWDRVLYWPMERLVHRFSSVGNRPFFAATEFDWIPGIEGRWAAIRAELDAVLRQREQIPSFHEVSSLQEKLTQDDRWKTYWLYAYGRKMVDNCRRCPETTRLIEGVPAIKTAFFSILGPRKHIPEHTGPYGGVLRYHLGLKVPRRKELCRIRVASEVACWDEGKGIVFDDTFPHEVWNDTDEERVVLFVDFARPLPYPLSIVNESVIRLFARSGYIQEIVDNIADWGRPVARAVDQPPEPLTVSDGTCRQTGVTS